MPSLKVKVGERVMVLSCQTREPNAAESGSVSQALNWKVGFQIGNIPAHPPGLFRVKLPLGVVHLLEDGLGAAVDGRGANRHRPHGEPQHCCSLRRGCQ